MTQTETKHPIAVMERNERTGAKEMRGREDFINAKWRLYWALFTFQKNFALPFARKPVPQQSIGGNNLCEPVCQQNNVRYMEEFYFFSSFTFSLTVPTSGTPRLPTGMYIVE